MRGGGEEASHKGSVPKPCAAVTSRIPALFLCGYHPLSCLSTTHSALPKICFLLSARSCRCQLPPPNPRGCGRPQPRCPRAQHTSNDHAQDPAKYGTSRASVRARAQDNCSFPPIIPSPRVWKKKGGSSASSATLLDAPLRPWDWLIHPVTSS